MITKTLTRKAFKEISTAAHRAAYAAAAMFLEKHDFQQGRVSGTDGLFIKHGYMEDANDEMTPIMKLVVGARLRNKHTLPQVGTLSINRLVRQSFAGSQAWIADDVQVSVKRFIEPITQFLAQYEEHLDVFAGIYENKFTNTNVLGIFIMLKNMEDEDKRLSWEITIDNADLADVSNVKHLFLDAA